MKAIPEKTAEYTPKLVIATPEGGSEALKASIVLKNHEITTSNRQRDLEWKQLVRDKNDRAASWLTAALRPMADMRLKEMLVKHAYPTPYEDQVNGGEMYRALVALKGK